MVYEFLAEGFEIVEALFPVDLLKRGGIEIKTVSLCESFVTASCGVCVKADINGSDFSLPKDAEMVILPGGMPGTTNLLESSMIKKVLKEAKERDIYTAAICAAPWVFDENGLLDGKKATMYPTMSEHMKKGIFTGEGIEISGKVITARGVGVAMEFGLVLVELLKGKETAKAVKDSIYPLN